MAVSEGALRETWFERVSQRDVSEKNMDGHEMDELPHLRASARTIWVTQRIASMKTV